MLTNISANCTLENQILFPKSFKEVDLMHICSKNGYSIEEKEQQEFLRFLKTSLDIMERTPSILSRQNTKEEWMLED
jgi:hypothetical protein